jgi:hypothetical protein
LLQRQRLSDDLRMGASRHSITKSPHTLPITLAQSHPILGLGAILQGLASVGSQRQGDREQQ